MKDCPHCNEIVNKKENQKSIWEEVKDKLNNEIDVIKIEKDNQYNDLKKIFNKNNEIINEINKKIEGYPTFILIDNKNNVISYDGDRDVESIVKFVNNKKGGNKNSKKIILDKFFKLKTVKKIKKKSTKKLKNIKKIRKTKNKKPKIKK